MRINQKFILRLIQIRNIKFIKMIYNQLITSKMINNNKKIFNKAYRKTKCIKIYPIMRFFKDHLNINKKYNKLFGTPLNRYIKIKTFLLGKYNR